MTSTGLRSGSRGTGIVAGSGGSGVAGGGGGAGSAPGGVVEGGESLLVELNGVEVGVYSNPFEFQTVDVADLVAVDPRPVLVVNAAETAPASGGATVDDDPNAVGVRPVLIVSESETVVAAPADADDSPGFVPEVQTTPTFVGASTTEQTDGTHSQMSAAPPAGVQPGDYLLVQTRIVGVGGTVNHPPDWELLVDPEWMGMTAGQVEGRYLYGRFADGTAADNFEPDHQSGSIGVLMTAWRGVDPSSWVAAEIGYLEDPPGSVDHDTPGLSGVTIGALIVHGAMNNDGPLSLTAGGATVEATMDTATLAAILASEEG